MRRRCVYQSLKDQITKITEKLSRKYHISIKQHYTSGRGYHLSISKKNVKNMPAEFTQIRTTKELGLFQTESASLINRK